MRYYYVETTINFTDNTDEVPWKSKETYSFIVGAKSKKQGKIDAEKRCIEEFENDLGKNNDDVKLVIDQFYEVGEDARAD